MNSAKWHLTVIKIFACFKRQMFIDPDDNMPLATVCEFYKNDVNFVFHDTPLNVMLNEFKSGDKGKTNCLLIQRTRFKNQS